jgi:hypothetical protein
VRSGLFWAGSRSKGKEVEKWKKSLAQHLETCF